MAEIRTKVSQKAPVKTLNRAENMAQRIRSGVKVTEKHSAEAAQTTSEDSYNARNADSFESGVKKGASETAHQSAKLTKKAAKKGVDKVESKTKEALQKHRQKKKAEQSVRQAQSSGRTATKATQNSNAVKTVETNTKAIRTKTSEVTKKTIKDNAAKASKQTVKTAGKQSVKTAKHGIRTAQKTAKSTIKTSKEAAKAAQKTAKAAEKAARAAAKAARAAAKAAVKTAQAVAKLIVKIIQAIIAAIKSLIAAIAAGGWVAVVVILVIVMIALILASVFGIFYSGEDSGTGMTMRDAITEINDEYNQKIEDIKSSNTYDVLDMSGTRAEWKNVLAVYASKMNMDPDNPDEVVTMDESKKQKLSDVFWDMHEISYNVTTSSSSSGGNTSSTEATERVTRTLHITVSHKTPDEMASQYGFSQDQIDSMHELLDSSNDSLWSALLHGISSSGDSDIVAVAQSQIGNVGGEPYWSWYGFSSRVEWCCCFVSWCANECGYIDGGIIPRYSVVDDGVNWFKNKGQWLDGNETPSPGMIIFFDWEYDGLDGSGDHTGIVEKVEDGRVYTIEGNASDKCQELSYSVGYYEILGYGYVDNISGVILLRPTVSPIIYKQQIGRALSTNTKKTPVIFDVVNNIENLNSIGTIQKEIKEAVRHYHELDLDELIVNQSFNIIDEVGNAKALFQELTDTLAASWDTMYGLAFDYYRTHGDLHVPSKFTTKEGYQLGHWIQTQRRVFRGESAGILDEERIQKLNDIHMEWDNHRDTEWDSHFQEAKQYYELHGDLKVPANYVTESGFKLGSWISNLRNNRKSHKNFASVSPERIDRLNSIGMIWDVLGSIWENYIKAAKRYYAEYGDLKPPKGYVDSHGVKLANWLQTMRSIYIGGTKKQITFR